MRKDSSKKECILHIRYQGRTYCSHVSTGDESILQANDVNLGLWLIPVRRLVGNQDAYRIIKYLNVREHQLTHVTFPIYPRQGRRLWTSGHSYIHTCIESSSHLLTLVVWRCSPSWVVDKASLPSTIHETIGHPSVHIITLLAYMSCLCS